MSTTLKRIQRKDAYEYAFDSKIPPKLFVKPGETFVLETEDAFSGEVRTKEVLPLPEHRPALKKGRSNPLAGPIYVEGVEPGDLLVVELQDIVPDVQGGTHWGPGRGPLGDSVRWKRFTEPYTHIIKHISGPSGTTRDGKAILNERISFDLKPFAGCLGVAPQWEAEPSGVAQGPWGGNLDVRDVTVGNKIYLNCYHKGGLFYLGDVHASQGDTEFSGTANETRAEVTLKLDVVKNKRIPFLRIEKPDSIISIYCERPLEDAVTNAAIHLMEWMMEYGLSQEEAYLLICICPDFRINVYQMAKLGRLRFTAGAEIPKKYLE